MEKVDDVTLAKKLIEENAQKRAEDCMAEIKQALEKHDCTIVIVPNIKINNQEVQIRITANK